MRRFSRRYLLIKNLLEKCLKKVLENFEAGTYKNVFHQDSHQNQNIFNTSKQSSRTLFEYLLTDFFQGPSQGGPQAQKHCPREHPPGQDLILRSLKKNLQPLILNNNPNLSNDLLNRKQPLTTTLFLTTAIGKPKPKSYR